MVRLNVVRIADVAEQFPEKVAAQQRTGGDRSQYRRKNDKRDLCQEAQEFPHDLEAVEIGADLDAAAELDPAGLMNGRENCPEAVDLLSSGLTVALGLLEDPVQAVNFGLVPIFSLIEAPVQFAKVLLMSACLGFKQSFIALGGRQQFAAKASNCSCSDCAHFTAFSSSLAL